MSLERNTRALIDLVQQAAASRRAALIDAARAQARAMLRDARQQARAQARRVFDDERARARQKLAAATATLQTRQRLALQRRDAALLASGWALLPEALVQRWQQPAARLAWIGRALAAARDALPTPEWRIVHPPDWPAGERDALAAKVAHDTGVAPRIDVDPALRAGIVITADATSVDATLDGLLADRNEIGAALLQQLEDQRDIHSIERAP
jgi:hypothetical protein